MRCHGRVRRIKEQSIEDRIDLSLASKCSKLPSGLCAVVPGRRPSQRQQFRSGRHAGYGARLASTLYLHFGAA